MKKILFLLLLSVSIYGQESTGQEQVMDYGLQNLSSQFVATPDTLVTKGTDGTYGHTSSYRLPISNDTFDALELKSNYSSTSIRTGCVLTNNGTTFNVSAGTFVIADNSTGSTVLTPVTFTGVSNVSPLYPRTILYITSTGTLVQFNGATGDLSPTQRRQNLLIGGFAFDGVNILAPSNTPNIDYDISQRFNDLTQTLGVRNQEGNVITANGANLMINKTSGRTFRHMGNYDFDKNSPDVTIDNAAIPIPAGINLLAYQNGVGGWTYEPYSGSLTPTFWDNGTGTKATVANNKFTIPRVYFFNGTDTYIFYLGQKEYGTIDAAIADADRSDRVIDPATSLSSYRGGIAIEKSVTDLTAGILANTVKFIPPPGGAGAAGGTVSTQNLQGVYNNSVNPEITTDATRGAFTVRNGQVSDTSNVLEGQNIAGSTTFSVAGSGNATTKTNFIVNRETVNYGGIMVQTNGLSRWYTHADNTAESGSNVGSDYRIQRFDDSGISLGTPLQINRATGLTSLTSLSLTDGTNTYENTLGSVVGNTGQPFYQSNKGYYIFKPSVSTIVPRFYLMPNGTATGTASKFEMFTTDYLADGANYSGLNIITNATNNDIQFGSNRLGTGGRLKMVFGGDYVGSALTSTSSRLEFNTNNSIGLNSAGGAVTFGENAIDPFSFSIGNQYTFKNPTTNQATRVNIVGNGTAAGVLAYGTGGVRNASTSIIGGTSDYVVSLNATNTGTTLTDYAKIFGATGNLVLKSGSITDNGVDKVQVTGSVLATTFKGGADLTGTPTAPTATSGTNTTQIATTAFVQSATGGYKVYTALVSQSGTSAPTAIVLNNTLGGTVTWGYTGVGIYTATLTGAFTSDKTAIFFARNPIFYEIGGERTDANTVTITVANSGTGAAVDSVLTKATIEFRVYP